MTCVGRSASAAIPQEAESPRTPRARPRESSPCSAPTLGSAAGASTPAASVGGSSTHAAPTPRVACEALPCGRRRGRPRGPRSPERLLAQPSHGLGLLIAYWPGSSRAAPAHRAEIGTPPRCAHVGSFHRAEGPGVGGHTSKNRGRSAGLGRRTHQSLHDLWPGDIETFASGDIPSPMAMLRSPLHRSGATDAQLVRRMHRTAPRSPPSGPGRGG